MQVHTLRSIQGCHGNNDVTTVHRSVILSLSFLYVICIAHFGFPISWRSFRTDNGGSTKFSKIMTPIQNPYREESRSRDSLPLRNLAGSRIEAIHFHWKRALKAIGIVPWPRPWLRSHNFNSILCFVTGQIPKWNHWLATWWFDNHLPRGKKKNHATTRVESPNKIRLFPHVLTLFTLTEIEKAFHRALTTYLIT